MLTRIKRWWALSRARRTLDHHGYCLVHFKEKTEWSLWEKDCLDCVTEAECAQKYRESERADKKQQEVSAAMAVLKEHGA